MLFNSFEFAVFLPIVFTIYWLLGKNLKLQNLFLVASSFVFYGWWSIGFLGLMVLSASVDFIVGILLTRTEKAAQRKALLFSSLFVNLGILCFFKYFNFFVDNFVSAFTLLGMHLEKSTLNVILPVGISFYTFQAMSYTIDVYRNRISPVRDPVIYFAFISFFPQLVAGPIERAEHMLPQYFRKRTFNYDEAVSGMRQMLWGLFKKVVIADACAVYVTEIFRDYQGLPAASLVLGALLFSIQIYCDFSGYSDIAIGSARLFGFSLMRNFNYPYFSRDIAEFWRRWHISLTSWFKDYVYIPLGGSRVSKAMQVRNVFIIFLLSGFWHGANWTYIIWGAWNACLFLPLLLSNRNRSNTGTVAVRRLIPSLKETAQIAGTFALVLVGWIIFRSQTAGDAGLYLLRILEGIVQDPLEVLSSFFSQVANMRVFIFVLLLFLMEWVQRDRPHALDIEHWHLSPVINKAIYSLLVFLIVWYAGAQQQFIYFQF